MRRGHDPEAWFPEHLSRWMLGLVWSVGQPDPARSQFTTSHLGWWNVIGALKP